MSPREGEGGREREGEGGGEGELREGEEEEIKNILPQTYTHVPPPYQL